MTKWILSVTVCCILLTVLGLFLPDGKTKKYILGITRVVIVFMIFEPLFSYLGKNGDILTTPEESISTMQKTSVTDSTSFFVSLTQIELNNKGIPCSVELTTGEDGAEYVDIYLKETVISEQAGNIYKNSKTVIETVGKYLSKDKEQIRVWSN